MCDDIIDMRQRKNESDRLQMLHRVTFSLSAFAFALATFCTLPLGQDAQFFPIYQLLIVVSSLLMLVAEVAEYAIQSIPMCSFLVFGFAALGLLLNIWSAFVYESFNRGELYLIAAFCFSLACELKLLFIVVKNTAAISQLFRQEKYRFIRYGCLAFGTIFFLAGSIAQLLQGQPLSNRLLASVLNSLGGLLFASSVVVLLRKDLHRGYAKFNYTMQIPRIV